jgi:hypothetical protein
MKKVVISKQKLMTHVRKFDGLVDVEFPEMRDFLQVKDDTVPVLRIKAASLSDQVRAQTLYERAAIKAVKLVECVTKGEPLTEVMDANEMSKQLNDKINDKAFLEISVFKRCVVKPKFTLREAVLISEALPEVVNRVAHTALKLSSLENLKNGD